MSTLDGSLALELAQYGYKRAKFLELHCGCNVRVAVAEPIDRYCCPVCHEEQAVTFLAEGFTRRELPFTEQISRALESPFGRRWLKQQRAQEQAAEMATTAPARSASNDESDVDVRVCKLPGNASGSALPRKPKMGRTQAVPLVAVGCA